MDNFKCDILLDTLLRIHAYDVGDTDFGLHDERARENIIKYIDSFPNGQLDEGFRLRLSRYVRDVMLSEKALAQGYGWEDVHEFLDWIDSGDFRCKW